MSFVSSLKEGKNTVRHCSLYMEFLGKFGNLRNRLLDSLCLSVRPCAWKNSVPARQLVVHIFTKICRENRV